MFVLCFFPDLIGGNLQFDSQAWYLQQHLGQFRTLNLPPSSPKITKTDSINYLRQEY